jgi:hypothetical protein
MFKFLEDLHDEIVEGRNAIVRNWSVNVVKEMLTFVNERVGLYNKLMENPELKKTLSGMMYEHYLNEKGYTRV